MWHPVDENNEPINCHKTLIWPQNTLQTVKTHIKNDPIFSTWGQKFCDTDICLVSAHKPTQPRHFPSIGIWVFFIQPPQTTNLLCQNRPTRLVWRSVLLYWKSPKIKSLCGIIIYSTKCNTIRNQYALTLFARCARFLFRRSRVSLRSLTKEEVKWLKKVTCMGVMFYSLAFFYNAPTKE